MAESVQASPAGLELVEQARRQKRWNKTAQRWCQAAYTSRSTMNRFWAGQAIRMDAFVAICGAVGVDWQAVVDPATLVEDPSAFTAASSSILPVVSVRQAAAQGPQRLIRDCGEQVDTSNFVGRQQAFDHLSAWCQDPGCRLINLVGMAGIGKTILMAHLVEQNADQFDGFVWKSLKTPLPLKQLLQDLLQRFRVDLPPAASPEVLVNTLIQTFTDHRYLLVLDHTETLMEPTSTVGDYRAGYAEYQMLFQQLGATRHQSCCVVIGREQSQTWGLREGDTVRTYLLMPFSAAETQMLLQTKGTFTAQRQDWETLTQQYGGNPLALQIVSTTILDFFQGDLSEFLAEGQVIFEGLAVFLQQQWQLLSASEQWVLFYLALCRTPQSFKAIKADLLDRSQQRRLMEMLSALHRRTLIERHTCEGLVTFGLSPAVLEYVTISLIDTLVQELARSQLSLLHQCPLLKVSAQDYLQQVQRQQVLQPILEQLKEQLSVDVAQHLEALLASLRGASPSYAAGNLVNLLIQLGHPLTGLQLSGLPLWEVNLATRPLYQVDLSGADLSRTVFAHAFGGVVCVKFSPDASRFATGHQNGGVSVWDSDQGQLLLSLNGHQSWIWAVDWSPDGNAVLSVSEDQTVRVWDTQTGDCLQVLEGHCDRIWKILCLSHHTAVTSSGDRSLKLWDFQTGECLKTLRGDSDGIALAVSEPERLIFSGGTNGQLHCWHWDTGQPLETWASQQGGIWALVYCASSQTLYSAGDSGLIEAWQLGTPTPTQTFGQSRGRIWALALSPCDRYLMAGGDNAQLIRWDLNSGESDQSLDGYRGRISAVDCGSTGNTAITASEDQTIRLWDVEQGQLLFNISSYSNWACEVSVLPSLEGHAAQVASAYSDGNLYLWNAEHGRLEQTLTGHQRSLWSLAVNPSGTHLVSGSDDGSLRIWQVGVSQCQLRLQGHQSRVWSVAWSPDGRAIASGSSDRTVKLWDPDSGNCVWTLAGHQSRVWAVSFSPDGQQVASGSGDRTLKLWDRQTGNCLATLAGHQSQVCSVAFHPEQPILASVGSDNTCRLWDLDTFTCQDTLAVPGKTNWSVTWSPDGDLLAIGSNDGAIFLWHAP